MGDDDQDVQKIQDHWKDDDHDHDEDKKSPRGADKEKRKDKINTIMLDNCWSAVKCIPLTVKNDILMMFIRLGFSQMAVEKLVDDQEIDSSITLANLSDENNATTCDVIRKSVA